MLIAIKGISNELFLGANEYAYGPMKIWKKGIHTCGLTINSIAGDYDKPSFQVEFPLWSFNARNKLKCQIMFSWVVSSDNTFLIAVLALENSN